MRIRVFLTAVLIIGLLSIGNLTFASGEKTTKDTTSETSMKAPGEMENHDYKGIVAKTDEGYTLLAGEITYLLQGEELEDMVGETVNISGQLMKTEQGDTIIVDKAELAK